MQINDDILQAFIHCPYKAYKKSKGQTGIISDYQMLYNQLKQTQKVNFGKQRSENIKLVSSNTTFDGILSKEGVALDLNFKNENTDITLDGVEFTGRKNIIPIFITPFEKVTRTDKLFVALQATLIQNEFNLRAEYCKIAFGENIRQTKFGLLSFAKTIKKSIAELNKILSNPNAPAFYKNAHCPVCEFQNSCLEKLVERDDLSLLTSLKSKEIIQRNNRGIFSVKQLSYTFRPKKNPYRKKIFLPELKALAIRESKTFIQEIPDIPTSRNEIFLDIEGLPDRNFYYLIGTVIRTNDSEKTYSFWANDKNEEEKIFTELIELLQTVEEFVIYHYGTYEIQALKIISKKVSPKHQEFLKKMIDNSFNVLNIFTHNIYPPTYSNSLKDIARFLKFEWTEKDASGLQSIVWRYKWEMTHNEELKLKLIQYNLEDCHALKKIKEWMVEIPNNESKNFEKATNIKRESIFTWGKINFLIEDLKEINNYAYFDYQRNKIYLKTSKTVKKAIHRKEVLQKSLNSIDKEIIHTSSQCPYCGSTDFRYVKSSNRIVVDLKFMKNGIKKWVVNNILYNYFCRNCKKQFVSKKYIKWWVSVYGENFALWSIYQYIQYHMSLDKIIKMLQDVFHLSISHKRLQVLQSKYVQKYSSTYEEIKKELMRGPFIHADETTGGVKDWSTGYVWVFANFDSALYMFKRNREADWV